MQYVCYHICLCECSVTTTVTNEITTVTEAETVTTAESTFVTTKNPMDYIDVTNVNVDLSSCVYPFSARRPPPLRWGMNCVPVPNVLDNKSKI